MTLALLAFGINIWFSWGVTIDDAYISARYAVHLFDGNGATFNPGERVEGFSNPTWVFVTGLFHRLFSHLEMYTVGRLAGLASSLLTGAIIVILWRSERLHPFACAIVLVTLASMPQIGFWTTAGLETTFYTLLLVSSMFLLARPDRTASASSAVLSGLASLSRPEGIAFAGLNTLLTLLTPPFFKVKKAIVYCGIVLAIAVPYLILRINYYESFLPNTFLAKSGGSQNFWRGLNYIIQNPTIPGALIAILAITSILYAKKNLVIRIFLSAAITQIAFIIWAGGDWMPVGRFTVPLTVFLSITAAYPLSALMTYFEQRKTKPFCLGVTLLMVLTILSLQILQSIKQHNEYFWRIAHGLDSRVVLGQWIDSYSPKSIKIAYGDMGALPFYSNRYFMDFHGLVDREIGEIIYKNKFSDRKLLMVDESIIRRKPDVVILINNQGTPFGPDFIPDEYGSPAIVKELNSRYKYVGNLLAYPKDAVRSYPEGRALMIFTRDESNLPGIAEFLKCANDSTANYMPPAQCLRHK
ncbi:hypothetical protein VXJ36_10940 [Pseudomonas nitroreducens]|uniref:hypothetical protein n=1 Tax=Pseudomonas nitroreducens TaxID=46680 RepID=UPI002F35D46F